MKALKEYINCVFWYIFEEVVEMNIEKMEKMLEQYKKKVEDLEEELEKIKGKEKQSLKEFEESELIEEIKVPSLKELKKK